MDIDKSTENGNWHWRYDRLVQQRYIHLIISIQNRSKSWFFHYIYFNNNFSQTKWN